MTFDEDRYLDAMLRCIVERRGGAPLTDPAGMRDAVLCRTLQAAKDAKTTGLGDFDALTLAIKAVERVIRCMYDQDAHWHQLRMPRDPVAVFADDDTWTDWYEGSIALAAEIDGREWKAMSFEERDAVRQARAAAEERARETEYQRRFEAFAEGRPDPPHWFRPSETPFGHTVAWYDPEQFGTPEARRDYAARVLAVYEESWPGGSATEDLRKEIEALSSDAT